MEEDVDDIRRHIKEVAFTFAMAHSIDTDEFVHEFLSSIHGLKALSMGCQCNDRLLQHFTSINQWYSLERILLHRSTFRKVSLINLLVQCSESLRSLTLFGATLSGPEDTWSALLANLRTYVPNLHCLNIARLWENVYVPRKTTR